MTNSVSPKAPSAASKLNILDNIDEGRLVEWFSENGKNLFYILIALVVLLTGIYIFSSSMSAKPEREYLQAASDFAFFTKATETQDGALAADAYKRLEGIMSKHPELHAAYDGALAQTFLNRNQLAQAKPYAEATLARTKTDDLPYYADYASTTLLISAEKYQEALDKSKSLQAKLTEALASRKAQDLQAFGDELFAFNLLRIAILQQQLGDKAGELASWQAWKQYAGLTGGKQQDVKVDPLAFRTIIQQLAVGSLSLPDYIAHREKALTK